MLFWEKITFFTDFSRSVAVSVAVLAIFAEHYKLYGSLSAVEKSPRETGTGPKGLEQA